MDEKPGYLFQASIQIGEAVALTVSGNLPKDADAKAMEAELDRVFDAMEKQNLKRMKLPAVKGTLQDQKDALVRIEKQFEEYKFQEQGRKLTSAEKSAMETCRHQIKDLEGKVSKGEEILAALEKKAA